MPEIQDSFNPEWPILRLIDVASYQNGHAFYKDGYSDHGLIAIDLFNVDEEGKLRFGPRDKYVAPGLCEKYARFKLNKGDLVIVMTDMTQTMGILGKTAMIDKDDAYILNQRIGRIVPDLDKVDTRYLHYFINSPLFLRPLHQLAKGSVQKYVNTGDIKEAKVSVPPLSIQHRIADILSNYDDLIDNNKRRIEILEEMARRLYEEWFVHFNLPRYKNMSFKESELGWIPEDWEVSRLDDVVALNPRTKVPKEGEKWFVPMGALSESNMTVGCLEKKTGNNGAKFQNGDTLVARITPCLENGKTGFVDFLPEDQPTACGSTEFIVMRSTTICPEMVYLLARSDRFRDVAIKSMSGATGRQRVRVDSLKDFPVIQPDQATLAVFQGFASPCFKEIRTLARKNTNLRAQRDLLLPKLVSGEIDVSDISMPDDKEVEAA